MRLLLINLKIKHYIKNLDIIITFFFICLAVNLYSFDLFNFYDTIIYVIFLTENFFKN